MHALKTQLSNERILALESKEVLLKSEIKDQSKIIENLGLELVDQQRKHQLKVMYLRNKIKDLKKVTISFFRKQTNSTEIII